MLSEKEFINTLLFEIRWSNPGSKSPKISAADAQKILDAGLKEGLLMVHEGTIKPVFDYKAIDIQLNYQPSRELLDELARSEDRGSASVVGTSTTDNATANKTVPLPLDVPLFAVIIEDIAKQTGQKKKDIVAKINRLQERMKVWPEVSALIIAREYGMDISKYIAVTKDEVLKK